MTTGSQQKKKKTQYDINFPLSFPCIWFSSKSPLLLFCEHIAQRNINIPAIIFLVKCACLFYKNASFPLFFRGHIEFSMTRIADINANDAEHGNAQCRYCLIHSNKSYHMLSKFYVISPNRMFEKKKMCLVIIHTNSIT